MQISAVNGQCLYRRLRAAVQCAAPAQKPSMKQRTRSNYARRHAAQAVAEQDSGLLVDGVVVKPAYRSTPVEAEKLEQASQRTKACITFVSESGVCRCLIAAATFRQLLESSSLSELVTVRTRASRDYCLGEGPAESLLAVANQLGLNQQYLLNPNQELDSSPTHNSSSSSNGSSGSSNGAGEAPTVAASSSSSNGSSSSSSSSGAVLFDPVCDIVSSDLVLVMDKYTAADVLREVSAYDLIYPGRRYSARVKLLGSYHPGLSSSSDPEGADMLDPLYGNLGGQEEQAAVMSTGEVIKEACRGLVAQLEQLAAAAAAAAAGGEVAGNGAAAAGGATAALGTGVSFREVVRSAATREGVISWLVPPLLQGSSGSSKEREDSLINWI